MEPAGPSEPKKRKLDDLVDSSTAQMQLIPLTPRPNSASQGQTSDPPARHELVARPISRMSLDLQPNFVKMLHTRSELGWKQSTGKIKLEIKALEINCEELRNCMTTVLTVALKRRFHTEASMRTAQILTEINDIVPLTVDTCMSALYSRLRTIHRSYGRYATRYTTAPQYTKDMEIPLPFAIAIQELGSFNTHSLETNVLYVPTYPEGTQHEGRSTSNFAPYHYQAYIPTLKKLGIPCKAIDTRIKGGSAWWTYKIENTNSTLDFICTLPQSHYSDLSAVIRAVFLDPGEDTVCKNFINFPADTQEYGFRVRELPPASLVSTFQALCHGPNEEWSFGTT